MPRHECPGGHFAGGTTMPTTTDSNRAVTDIRPNFPPLLLFLRKSFFSSSEPMRNTLALAFIFSKDKSKHYFQFTKCRIIPVQLASSPGPVLLKLRGGKQFIKVTGGKTVFVFPPRNFNKTGPGDEATVQQECFFSHLPTFPVFHYTINTVMCPGTFFTDILLNKEL